MKRLKMLSAQRSSIVSSCPGGFTTDTVSHGLSVSMWTAPAALAMRTNGAEGREEAHRRAALRAVEDAAHQLTIAIAKSWQTMRRMRPS
jgi:hypothetical protein